MNTDPPPPHDPQGSKPILVKFAEAVKSNEKRLFVASIPAEASKEVLGELFGQHGEVVQISLHRRDGDEPSQYAFVK